MPFSPIPSPRNACMAQLSADITGHDYSGGGAVPWGAELYDDAGWHSTSVNTDRLTVPAGVTRVRLGFTLEFANVTAATYMYIQVTKNGGGGSVNGQPEIVANASVANPRFTASSGQIPVVAGDYFDVVLIIQDTSVDIIAASSSFWIEAV